MGCQECIALAAGALPEVPFTVSSQIFGCADVDALLPSLHWIYEEARRRLQGELPGILVDGGANVGRATSRWVAALGDTFGRRMAANKTQAPCIICAGADATAGGGAAGAASSPPTVAVVSVEPSASNFALLQKHALEGGWHYEGFLGLHAALGSESGEAMLAFNDDFAIDEIATILFQPTDSRPRQRVRVMTLDGVVDSVRDALPGIGGSAGSIFLLKLDIEGMEPAVLRSIANSRAHVKFVTFEYASNVWQEPLSGVVADLARDGYFCFLITPERLIPVSPPFWDVAYELPMWSNLLCGLEGDPDLSALVQLHAGAVGLWPLLPRTFLRGHAGDNEAPLSLAAAKKLCTDLGAACRGVTCDCPADFAGICGRPPAPPPGPCTPRSGSGGAQWSPSGEVTFMRDPEASELFLLYRRSLEPAASLRPA